jgi:hypothetical protein
MVEGKERKPVEMRPFLDQNLLIGELGWSIVGINKEFKTHHEHQNRRERGVGGPQSPSTAKDRGREPGIPAGESRRVVALARMISYVGYEMRFQHKIMIQ